MEINLDEEAPNVVTETLFQSLLQDGYQAEVVCRSEAYKKASVWYGEWIIRVVNHERTFERLLVTARAKSSADQISVRIFKTGYGLISFLENAGFEQVTVPLVEGRRSMHSLSVDGKIPKPE